MFHMQDTTYFVNGSYVKKENASIHVNDIGLLRGFAVFDYFKTYFGIPFRIKDHLERLQISASLIGLDLPYSHEEITNICNELLKRNNFTESNIRVVVTGGVGADSKTKGDSGFIMTCEPRYNWDDIFYTDGIKIKTITGRRDLWLSKTCNYIRAIEYISKYKEQGFSEYLYTFENKIYECTSSNVYIIKDGKVITTDDGVLRGITRKVIFEIINKFMPIEIREITLDESYSADEVFISSTEKEIMPVVTIDDKRVGSGEVGKCVKQLINGFREYVNSKEWTQS
jgi:branched-chain amino acid aminotransferase